MLTYMRIMKMKKAIAIASALLGTFGCSAESAAPADKVAVQPSRVLVAYYSWSPSGNTRHFAEQIQKATGGTLYEIKLRTPYPAAYSECVEQVKKEVREDFKPALAGTVENFGQYDVVFVGSPNWWGTVSRPVASFYSAFDFAGKTVIPFFTNGGGGMQNCEKDARRLLQHDAKKAPRTILPARTYSGAAVHRADKEIAGWVNSILELKP